MITKEQLRKIMPRLSEERADLYLHDLISAMEVYEINTPLRIAAFLSQIGHESLDLIVWQENLSYSSDGLMKTFKKYFPTIKLAQEYARMPERIANRVYANRMGNGNEESGDGWKYRGRGPIQVTGKDMYSTLSVLLKINLISKPDDLFIPAYGFKSAGAIWTTIKNLNPLADVEDVTGITRRINGGLNGLDDRVKRYNIATGILLS